MKAGSWVLGMGPGVWGRMLVSFALLGIVGCAKPAGVIFEPMERPLVWPAPPAAARIRYVGELRTSADLKPAVGFGQQIGNALFGKKDSKSMLSPYAVCTDGAERLFVADSNAQVVHVFDLKTRRYSELRPAVAEKRFTQPVGVAWDRAGQLFVADSVARCIFVFDGELRFKGEIGNSFVQRPCGLAVDAERGRLYVADAAAHQVVVLTLAGQLVERMGERGTGLGQFNYPTNVAVDSQGRLYVSDSLNFRVQQFSPDLKPLQQIGTKGDLPGYFGQPKGIALDGQDHLYVVDSNFEAVQIFDSNGQLLLDFGEEGRGPGQFWLPAGIFIDARNRIWVADSYNRRVQVFEFIAEGNHEK